MRKFKKESIKYKLIKECINHRVLDALKKNENITMLTLEKLCTIIDCTPNEIVQFKK
ncbi:MAG: helix-turn-helix domain-containing protein [Anaerotignum sp.]|nr:helix-turn-helix domain-containing protein [Anaerotignum sp.]